MLFTVSYSLYATHFRFFNGLDFIHCRFLLCQFLFPDSSFFAHHLHLVRIITTDIVRAGFQVLANGGIVFKAPGMHRRKRQYCITRPYKRPAILCPVSPRGGPPSLFLQGDCYRFDEGASKPSLNCTEKRNQET